ncbi:MAG: hypothetical protein RL318_2914, partial [Fibrobacterota bacterium]
MESEPDFTEPLTKLAPLPLDRENLQCKPRPHLLRNLDSKGSFPPWRPVG